MVNINEPLRVKNIDFEILFGLNKKSSILIFLDELKLEVLNYFTESDFSLTLISKNEGRLEKARKNCSSLKICNANFLNYKKTEELILDKARYDFIIKGGAGNLCAVKKILRSCGRVCFLCQNIFF